MHGVIFLNLKSYTEHSLKKDWRDLLEVAGYGSREYSFHDSYPVQEFRALIRTLAQAIGEPEKELIEHFGIYLAPKLLEIAMFLKLIESTWKTFDVLEALATRIHAKVQDLDPSFEPPAARGVRTGKREIEFYYKSDNNLCVLAKGILRGMAQHFRETLSIEEQECTSEGASTCRFIVKETEVYDQTSSIHDLFRQARNADTPIHAYNVFKGVSVTGEVLVTQVVGELVTVRVSQYQAVSMKLAGSTHLKSPAFTRNVIAQVREVNVHRSEVVLHRFTYTDSVIGERHAMRVAPLEKIEAIVNLKSRTVRGVLADLSEEGAGILINDRLVAREHQSYFPKVTFQLPERYFGSGASSQIQLHAEICGLYRDGGQNVLGLSFKEPPSETRALLSRYVSQRQMEITREFQLYT